MCKSLVANFCALPLHELLPGVSVQPPDTPSAILPDPEPPPSPPLGVTTATNNDIVHDLSTTDNDNNANALCPLYVTKAPKEPQQDPTLIYHPALYTLTLDYFPPVSHLTTSFIRCNTPTGIFHQEPLPDIENPLFTMDPDSTSASPAFESDYVVTSCSVTPQILFTLSDVSQPITAQADSGANIGITPDPQAVYNYKTIVPF